MMEAQFDSLCPDCGIEIESGDIIGKREEQWVCAPCAYTYDVAEANASARSRHPSNANHQQHPSGGAKNGHRPTG